MTHHDPIKPYRSCEADLGRARFVRALHNLAKYGRGRLSIGLLDSQEAADMRDLAARGPGVRMSRADPESYAILKEATMAMWTDGVIDEQPKWFTAAEGSNALP